MTADPSAARSDAVHRAVALFVSVVACGAGGALIHTRSLVGDRPIGIAAQCIGLLLLLVNGGVALRSLARARADRWWTSPAALSLFTLVLLALAGYLRTAPALGVGRAAVVLGWTSLLVNLVHARPRSVGDAVRLVAGAALALALGWWAAIDLWQRAYSHPLQPEGWTVGIIRLDELFHTSVSNMIHTYGVASTGLDGLVPLRYHVGSHWLFGQLSQLCGLSVMQVYSYAFPVIFLPYFFWAVLTCAASVRAFRDPSLRAPSIMFWLILVIALVGFRGEAFEPSLMDSESYVVALSLSLMWLTIAFVAGSQDGPCSLVESVLTPVAIAGLLVAIAFTKISLPLMLLGAAFFGAWRSGRWRRPVVLATLALAAAGYVMATRLTDDANHVPVVPFHYLRTWVQPEQRPFYYLIYYFWPLLFLVWRVRELGLQSPTELVAAARRGALLDVELALCVALVGELPGEVFALPGAAGLYFCDFQRWFALALLLSVDRGARLRDRWSLERIGGWTLATFALLAVAYRANTAYESSETLAASMIASLGRADSRLAPIKANLARLASLPRGQKQRSAVFVPWDNDLFWSLPPRNSMRVDFVIPSLTGMMLLGGARRTDDAVVAQAAGAHGFLRYALRTQAPSLDRDRLCADAARDGVTRIWVLGADELRELACR